METIIYSLQDVPMVVGLLDHKMQAYQILTFTGHLGTGKTTLVQALLRKKGIQGVITSPTFTYVNIYENDHNQTFYHFDAYRIQSLHDFKSAGFDEYLYQPNSWCFIEWPEVIKPILDHSVLHVTLDYEDNKRIMKLEEVG